jgi:hypothetical protein
MRKEKGTWFGRFGYAKDRQMKRCAEMTKRGYPKGKTCTKEEYRL